MQHQAIDAEQDQRTDDRCEEPGILAMRVPPEGAAEEARDQRSRDAISIVTMMPPGSLPGMISFASAPAMSPMISIQMICMTYPFGPLSERP